MTLVDVACTARRHGTALAYNKDSCRCPDARAAHGRYQAQLSLGTAPPGLVPSVASTRILRGLYLLGHDREVIAPAAGLTVRTVNRLVKGEYPLTLASTARAVAAAAEHLARLPAAGHPNRIRAAKARGRREHWAPLSAWDGEVFAIDDAAADERLAADTAHLPACLRQVLRDEAAAEAARALEVKQTLQTSLDHVRDRRWRVPA